MRFAWLFPIVLCAAPARYARVGDSDGEVEVQLQAADEWQAVEHNMPVGELAWLRTGPSSRLELELDDGSVLRLGANSLAELSDYTRLSTGQRVTLISLDHGLAYFTGTAEGHDALILALPGAQVTIQQAAKVRLESSADWSQISAGEGSVRFSSPSAEFDLKEGEMVRLDPAHPSRFSLSDRIAALETDQWCDERDKLLESTVSAAHVPGLRYGLADLDGNGTWVQSGDLGAVWKPKAAVSWVPYRNGKWVWYDGLGYTWIGADAWGWLPYHYGRWMLDQTIGWVWAPGKITVFKPGEVYWLKSAKLVGWGPLAPGEDWQPPDVPRLFLNANTTYAPFTAEAREIDPAGFSTRPKEPLATAAFVAALPSPAFPAARLDATRPLLRAGSTRIVPVLEGVTFAGSTDPVDPPPPEKPPASAPVADASAQPAEQPVTIVNAPADAGTPPDSPVPVYTGIIIVLPPQSKTQPVGTTPGRPGTAPSKPPRKKPAESGAR